MATKKAQSKNSEKTASKPAAKSVAKGTTKNAKPAKTESKLPKPTKVDHGHVVHVDYVGTLDSGEEFDNSKTHGPIQFKVGGGQVIKGFDDAVRGMKVGESKKFKINKKDAYGDVNPQMMHKVPLEKLPADIRSQVKVGGFIMLQSPTGQQMPVRVAALDKKEITLDMNHPLAGKDLTFDIKVVDINHPSKEEDCCGGSCGCGHDGHEGHDGDDNCCGGGSCGCK